MLGLNKLGFYPELQSIFESIVEKPYGMVLVTGLDRLRQIDDSLFCAEQV